MVNVYSFLIKLFEIRRSKSIKELLYVLEYGATDSWTYPNDSFIRKRAAQTLGLIGDTRAVEPLIKTLDDGDKWVRMASIWALGRLGDARASKTLVQALNDEERLVRLEAERALVKIKVNNTA